MTHQAIVERLRAMEAIGYGLTDKDKQALREAADALTGQEGAAPSPRAEGSEERDNMLASILVALHAVEHERPADAFRALSRWKDYRLGDPPEGTEPTGKGAAQESSANEIREKLTRKVPQG